MILICGIPNAGKTTYSQNFPNVIHFDDIKGGRKRRQIIADMVRNNPSICVEGVYATANERIELVKASNEYNICIWLDTPLDFCIEREITGRQRSESIVIWASEQFEPPTYEEGWDEIKVIEWEKK